MTDSFKFALALLTALPAVACERAPAADEVAHSQPSAANHVVTTSQLTRVTNPSEVCMINNRFMASPQIPVAVDGKTYYGCCAGCKAKLESDPSARQAVDPVTKKPVDKALAVLGRTTAGEVFYFENEGTFTRFAQSSAQN